MAAARAARSSRSARMASRRPASCGGTSSAARRGCCSSRWSTGREAEVHPNLSQFLDWTRRTPKLTAERLLEVEIRRDLLKARFLRADGATIPCCSAPSRRSRRSATASARGRSRAATVHYLDAWRYTAWFNLLQNPGRVRARAGQTAGWPAHRRAGRGAAPWEEADGAGRRARRSSSAGRHGPSSGRRRRLKPGTRPDRCRPDLAPLPLRLVAGLAVSLVTIGGVALLYTAREIRQLRDEQTAISERNRGTRCSCCASRTTSRRWPRRCATWPTGPSPIRSSSWRQTFDRLRADLAQAIKLEQTLAPAERPAAQQERLRASVDRFWTLVDDVHAAGAGDDDGPIAQAARQGRRAQHQELVGMVSQFLVLNNRVQEEAAQRTARSTSASSGRSSCSVVVLFLVVGITGVWASAPTACVRRGRAAVGRAAQPLVADAADAGRPAAEFSRELHDEFGQISRPSARCSAA